MKKTVIYNMLSVVALFSFTLAVVSSNATCFFFVHQPKEPLEMKKYKNVRN